MRSMVNITLAELELRKFNTVQFSNRTATRVTVLANRLRGAVADLHSRLNEQLRYRRFGQQRGYVPWEKEKLCVLHLSLRPALLTKSSCKMTRLCESRFEFDDKFVFP